MRSMDQDLHGNPATPAASAGLLRKRKSFQCACGKDIRVDNSSNRGAAGACNKCLKGGARQVHVNKRKNKAVVKGFISPC